MSLSRIKRRLKSGNHGSDSSEQSAAPGVPGTFSTAPRQSRQVFVPPVTVPVKKTPKISDVLQDPVPVTSSPQSMVMEQPSESTETPASQISQSSAEPQDRMGEVSSESSDVEVEQETMGVSEASENSPGTEAMGISEENEVPQTISSSDEKFVSAWNTMFELLFREIATIYYPLKGVVPSIENNVIQVKVKNEMMKDNFESRVRLALEYLRNNFDQRIDDIQVEVESNPAQTSKLIYDTQDKMNDLNKENPDLPEFLKILNLSAKDM